ncbi:MAG: ATP-dependent RecD-like DNA helicase [Sandaracinus sp.]|nr:ATP-dependent RecD-like DNA helicase [Sandaracinus sp.]
MRTSAPLGEEILEGTVDDVSFRSADGRFTVAQVSVHRAGGKTETMTAVGDLGAVAPGETLRMHGRASRHAKYGDRFRVRTFTPVIPSTASGIERFLGSGMIPGIGKGLAKKLVKRFGDRTLEIIATETGRLREVDGIGKVKAAAISDAVKVRREEAERLAFLHGLGLGPAMARRIIERFGENAARVVRDDPYLVAEEVRGIGFRTADAIGRAVGIPDDDPRRAAGVVMHVLARGADSGHTYLPRQVIIDEARQLDVPADRVSEAVDALAGRGLVILDTVEGAEAVYAPPLHRAERHLAKRLRALARPRAVPAHAEAAVRRAIGDTSLSEEQERAVARSVSHGLMVLTGGPGTGKTTTIRAVVEAQLALERRIVLAAPTGRAAKRMTEATGVEAKTVHRLLEFNPRTGGFQRNREAPLDAEVVLVDEASMLDVQLAQSLVDAVAPSSRLVLVGDVDQLPPVGPGPVLREVLQSGVAEVVRLTQVFRQAQKSAIVRGAHAILRGEAPEPSPSGEPTGDGDVFFVRARTPEEAHTRLQQVLARIVKRYGFDPTRDVQVLSPMRRGGFGTETLNAMMQRALNAEAKPKKPGDLAIGDKVMQLRNDYDKDVYNGDLGMVARVEGGITYVRIDGREVQYQVKDLDQLVLAYASTVHKVQGSEFPAVVLVLHGAHHVMLTRPLLYTALTRAKKLAVLIGDRRAIARAAANASSTAAWAGLADRLRHPRGDDLDESGGDES